MERSKRSPDGAQRNPGATSPRVPAFRFASCGLPTTPPPPPHSSKRSPDGAQRNPGATSPRVPAFRFAPCGLPPPPLLRRITAALDLLDERPPRRPPVKLGAGSAGAHAAVRTHGVLGRALAPFRRRLLDRHALRPRAQAQHAADRLAHLAHRVLAVLGEIEGARRRAVERREIE